jgi:competence protein ComEA
VIKKLLTIAGDMVKRNTFAFILGTLLFGCGVGFFVAGKGKSSGCVLAMDTQSGSANSDVNIVADLSGAVSKPGVYKLSTNFRVGDLINEGGGVVGEASKTWISKNLNLSKRLDDSTKIYIPFEWEIISQNNNDIVRTEAPSNSNSISSGSQSSNEEDSGNSGVGVDGKTNVNTASSAELDKLSGIGPAYAEKIISGRPYTDMADFESRSGLWASTISGIKNLITF